MVRSGEKSWRPRLLRSEEMRLKPRVKWCTAHPKLKEYLAESPISLVRSEEFRWHKGRHSAGPKNYGFHISLAALSSRYSETCLFLKYECNRLWAALGLAKALSRLRWSCVISSIATEEETVPGVDLSYQISFCCRPGLSEVLRRSAHAQWRALSSIRRRFCTNWIVAVR